MAGGNGTKEVQSSVLVAVSKVVLPPKKYFKIGEVAHLVGVEPHVLRYWQTQFPQVRPQKSRSGHRLYRRKDVETLLAVKELLHVQRFTIAGARQALRSSVVQSDVPTVVPREVDDGDGEAALAAAGPADDETELELIGLEPTALAEELAVELFARRGETLTAVEIDTAPDDGDGHARAGHDGHERAAATVGGLPDVAIASRADVVVVAAAKAGGTDGARALAPSHEAARVAAPAATVVAAPAAAAALPSSEPSRAQLALGFAGGARAALVEAREELRGLLRLLDAEAPPERRRHAAHR